MSKTQITVERVNEVEHHPMASRLDIIQVKGYRVICGRDQFRVGDAAIYFPINMLIPLSVSEELGVTKYLKHATYPGDSGRSKCRISSCRLRNIPSHGFVAGPIEHDGPFGTDLTAQYGGHKYEPPVRTDGNYAQQETPNFHRYTRIKTIQRYPKLIPEGTPVRVTEKIHGTSCRIGLCRDDGVFQYMAGGAYKVKREPCTGIYWSPFIDVQPLLEHLSNGEHDVIVFGEIFGPSIQDLDYGQSERTFRVFDISVDTIYLDWADVVELCGRFDIPLVPLLACGPFDLDWIKALTYGPTTFDNVKSDFKGREGVVVTPLQEILPYGRGGRKILKSVSADYRNRKNPTDIE
jgi:RNA ligase (TIGR02306 family)